MFRPFDTYDLENMAEVISLLLWCLFSSLAKISGECLTIHFLPAVFVFVFEVEIGSRALIPLFMPGSVQSGSAS